MAKIKQNYSFIILYLCILINCPIQTINNGPGLDLEKKKQNKTIRTGKLLFFFKSDLMNRRYRPINHLSLQLTSKFHVYVFLYLQKSQLYNSLHLAKVRRSYVGSLELEAESYVIIIYKTTTFSNPRQISTKM